MKVYEIVQELLLKSIASGTAPWHKPWAGTAINNFATGKQYHGINECLLPMQLDMKGMPIASQYIGSSQAKAKGLKLLPHYGHENSLICVYYGPGVKKDPETGDIESSYKFLRYSRVYPAYCYGVGAETEPKVQKWSEIGSARDIVAGYDVDICHDGGNRAFYASDNDKVFMPDPGAFESATGYYATLFHELGHSTGHKSRLNRPLGNKKSSQAYAKEELIAEITSAYLCGVAGIDHEATIENNAAYIKSWSENISNAGAYICTAFSQAAKSADFILTNGASHVQ